MKTKNTKADKSKKEVNKNNNNNRGGESETESRLEIVLKEDEENEKENYTEKETKTSTANTVTNKRTINDATEKNVNAAPKKMRRKAKPEIIDNMKDHVDNNTIDKLTTTTLMHWLKSNSIYCTTRDKKSILIAKVKSHFDAK